MKRFIISEEEKSRILGMHKEATKRHYLGEQGSAPSQTFSPENVKKIKNAADEKLKRGDKQGFFTIDSLPTFMFGLNNSNNFANEPLMVYRGYSGVPLEVRGFGQLYIKLESGAQVGGQKLIPDFEAFPNAMAPIQKEDDAINAAETFGKAFGTSLPKDVTSKVLINTYNTMTEQNKNNFMAFLQRTNPELDTYKREIKSTLGLS